MVKTSKKMTGLGVKLLQITNLLHARLNLWNYLTYIMSAMTLEMIIQNIWSRKMQLMVSFIIGLDDNDNFDDDNNDGGSDFTVHEELLWISDISHIFFPFIC